MLGAMTTPPPGPPQHYPGAAPQPMNPSDEKLWAILIHLGGLFVSFFVPLVGYLVLRDRGPFVRAHAATALNFQLTLLIAYVVGFVLIFVVIGFFVILAAWICAVVFGIIAAIKASQGEWYTYPMAIKFVS